MAARRVNGQLCSVLALVLGTCLAGCALASCSPTKWVGVETGEYVVGLCWGEPHDVAMGAVQTLEIDRNERTAVIRLADGSAIVAPFVPRHRADWPAGCPTNIYTHRMEVLDIEQEELAIGPVTLANPILVRDCPPDPVHVVLREDGEIGNAGGVSGSACSRTEPCICFKRDLIFSQTLVRSQ